ERKNFVIQKKKLLAIYFSKLPMDALVSIIARTTAFDSGLMTSFHVLKRKSSLWIGVIFGFPSCAFLFKAVKIVWFLFTFPFITFHIICYDFCFILFLQIRHLQFFK